MKTSTKAAIGVFTGISLSGLFVALASGVKWGTYDAGGYAFCTLFAAWGFCRAYLSMDVHELEWYLDAHGLTQDFNKWVQEVRKNDARV